MLQQHLLVEKRLYEKPNYLEDVFGTYIYPGEDYYDIDGDVVHEDNLKEYFSNDRKEYQPW